MSPYWWRRFRRHTWLGLGCAASVGAGAAMIRSPDLIWKVSVITAWVAALLVAVTLALGPGNVLRRVPNPVSTDVRRDVGIWAAILALVHTGVGLFVHHRGRPWRYFFPDFPPARPRVDVFGFVNWTGLAGTVLVGALLVLSNDWALRRLGAARWKSLQRWNYGLFGLITAHGLVYQLVVEDRSGRFVLLFVVALAATAGLQVAGYLAVRKRSRGP